MRSQWYKLKPKAIELRQAGNSIRTIESKLRIPKSTLSYWFKGLTLSKEKQVKLRKDWERALVKARGKAVLWHNSQKAARLIVAEQEAKKVLNKINSNNKYIIDLALAMLYLGEGFKGNTTGIGNSDPKILKFFIAVLQKNYNVPRADIRAELHIRADQDAIKVKKFWAKQLGLRDSNFGSTSVDLRTKGSTTYSTYNGVCVIRCGRVSIQRKLLMISKLFCEKVTI